jgi:hypothetical protein
MDGLVKLSRFGALATSTASSNAKFGPHVKMPHAGFQSLEGWTLLLIFERKKKDHLAAVSPKSDQVF